MMDRRFNNISCEHMYMDGTELTRTETVTRYEPLMVGNGTNTALATTGVDLTNTTGGTAVTYYGAFFAPAAIEVTNLYILLTEAYKKSTNDCKIEVYDNTGTPVKIFGTTLAAAGVAVGTMITVAVETGKGALTAGKRLDVKITTTDNDSGTGFAVMKIGYTI